MHTLGDTYTKRFSIFSFLIRVEKAELYLHPRFVAQLMHDLFGVQPRVLDAFASPYAASLMGITSSYQKDFAEATKDLKVKLLEPCFNRISLPYFISSRELDFVLEAIRFVCIHGYKFLVLYNFDMESGDWQHQSFHVSAHLWRPKESLLNKQPALVIFRRAWSPACFRRSIIQTTGSTTNQTPRALLKQLHLPTK